MYQGKNPTALNSQKILLDSLNVLLKERAFKDISVSEICGRSGISRQTFYSLFGTKENLLLYHMRNAFYVKKPSVDSASEVTLKETCVNYGKYVAANYEQLKMLVDNDLMSLLSKLFYESMSDSPQNYMDLYDEEREYALRFLSSGLCSLTQEYVKHHEIPDPAELTRLSYKIMSGGIYKL